MATPVEFRARLSTLLDLDDLPGEACGWGPLLASDLRAAVSVAGATWRWVLTDDAGYLLAMGLTRRRPRTGPHRRTSARTPGRVLIEIAVSVSLLGALRPADHPAWAHVLAELRSHADRLGDAGEVEGTVTDATRRFAGAALDRAVRARDRRCRGPACRAPVHSAELDHTRDHARGGPTLHDNLGAHCWHDHQLKTRGGWQLDQPSPGTFRWTSRAGATYTRAPEAVVPDLPAARSTTRTGSPEPDVPGPRRRDLTFYPEEPPF